MEFRRPRITGERSTVIMPPIFLKTMVALQPLTDAWHSTWEQILAIVSL